jgi:hypothetical protein
LKLPPITAARKAAFVTGVGRDAERALMTPIKQALVVVAHREGSDETRRGKRPAGLWKSNSSMVVSMTTILALRRAVAEEV